MARVNIKIENDNGDIMDEATVSMNDDVLQLTIEAMAVSRGWNEEGSLSKTRWFSLQLRKYAESQLEWYVNKLATDSALNQAESIKNSITLV